MNKRLEILLMIALLPGCTALKTEENLDYLPAAQVAAISAMPELGDKELARQPHESLGKVEGVSCRRPYTDSTPSWEADDPADKIRSHEKGRQCDRQSPPAACPKGDPSPRCVPSPSAARRMRFW